MDIPVELITVNIAISGNGDREEINEHRATNVELLGVSRTPSV
jgi:hypothetical protein